MSGHDEPNSRAMIGYLNGQDGAILPAQDFLLGPARSMIIFWCFIPYNQSFIDQACSVKMAGYWPRSFFACLWTSKKKHAKRELGGPISNHLDRTHLVNNLYLISLRVRSCFGMLL